MPRRNFFGKISQAEVQPISLWHTSASGYLQAPLEQRPKLLQKPDIVFGKKP